MSQAQLERQWKEGMNLAYEIEKQGAATVHWLTLRPKPTPQDERPSP